MDENIAIEDTNNKKVLRGSKIYTTYDPNKDGNKLLVKLKKHSISQVDKNFNSGDSKREFIKITLDEEDIKQLEESEKYYLYKHIINEYLTPPKKKYIYESNGYELNDNESDGNKPNGNESDEYEPNRNEPYEYEPSGHESDDYESDGCEPNENDGIRTDTTINS